MVMLFLLVAFAVGVRAYLFLNEVMAGARIHDCFEDILVAGHTDLVFIAVFVLEEFPFRDSVKDAIVQGIDGLAGDGPVLGVQGAFSLICSVVPD
jgi:hypothetical protein